MDVFMETFSSAENVGAWAISDAHDEGYSLMPPSLPASAESEWQIDCDGVEHNQLSFEFRYAGQLYVDGELYEDLEGGYSWSRRVIVLPHGPHQYTFKVTAGTAPGRPDFRLDTIVCTDTEPHSSPTPTFGFDQHFTPPEFDGFETMTPATTWQITNETAHGGEFGARPPLMDASSTTSLSTDCGGAEHTQLSFHFRYDAELYVDGELYETLEGGYSWAQRLLAVPRGTHTYTFKVTSGTAPGRPPFRLDTVTCTDKPPEPSATPTFGFDQGFAPPEFPGFLEGTPATTWQITNESAQGSEFGVRPPLMDASSRVSLTTDCGGKTHTRFSFHYRYNGRLYVDGKLYEDIEGGYSWTQRDLVVPRGKHSYTFEVTSGTAPERPAFRLDTVVCTDKEPTPRPTPTFGFDEGFMPIEFDGFETGSPAEAWQITNESVQSGDLAVRPPILEPSATISLDTNCGGKPHKQVSFQFRYVGKLCVDDGPCEALEGGYSWQQKTLPVTPGTHAYRIEVTAGAATGRPPFRLDTFVCTP
jgi:hypothetical protein